jgi:hypothetical protein
MVHKYYPKLGTQNNQPNTTATVHEVKRQEHMSEYWIWENSNALWTKHDIDQLSFIILHYHNISDEMTLENEN